MRILLIHELGRPQSSGAVIAMYRLHEALLKKGHDSTIACVSGDFSRPDVVPLPQAGRLEGLIRRGTWRMGLNDLHCLSTFRISDLEAFRSADVVNIHGFHSGFFNYLALPRLSRSKPIIATFHDMWNFTGHCSYSFECERWKTGCGKCPHPETYPPIARDATAVEWKLKRWAYRRSSFEIIVPTRWLQQMVQQSMLRDVPVHVVPSGTDHDVYRPVDRALARDALGVPRDPPVILFAAASFKSRMKGADLLLLALKRLPEEIRRRALLLLFGDCGSDFVKVTGMEAITLGYVQSDRIKALAYSAADVFVLPSRAEVQGLVLQEAMACGTPAVAFDVGGVGESVRPERTGYLARAEDVDDLSHGIARLLEDGALRQSLGEGGQRMVSEEYSTERMAERYLQVFEQNLDGVRRRAAGNGATRRGERDPSLVIGQLGDS